MTAAPEFIGSLWAVGILTALATGVLLMFRVPDAWAPAIAIARGVVQLAVLSLILGGILGSPLWIGVALLAMFAVAVTVATRRIGWSPRHLALAVGAMGIGVIGALVVVFATGALAPTPRYALAIGAIVIGGSMTVASLAGRGFIAGVDDHWDEVEGWLALGATPRRSTLSHARRAAGDALIPSTDQTKTTGLVVLPGAFVGAIFGGLSPIDAARFQIVVLAAIMAAGAITAVLVTAGLSDIRTRPRR